MADQAPLRDALRQSLGASRLPLAAFAAVTGLFLLIPIAVIFPIAVTQDFILIWPPHPFSTRWFEMFFTGPVWTAPLIRSFAIAVPVSLIATVIGTFAALGISHAHRGRRLLQALFIAPIVLPAVTYALGLYDVAQRLHITGGILPVVVGQSMLATPLVFLVVTAALARRDRQLLNAAASLGASPLVILTRIELPLIRDSIAAGALVALATSFDEIIVAYFLLPPGTATLPVQILGSTRESADPTIAAASVVVIGVAATIAAIAALVNTVLKRRLP